MVNATERGAASDKISGTTLTIPSFTIPAGHSLAVFAGYDNAQTAPTSVVHAGRDLRRRTQRNDGPNSFHASWWLKGEYRGPQTGTCVLTWASAIGKKAAFATSFDILFKEDDDASALTATSIAPVTGSTGVLNGSTIMALCGFACEGPGSEAGGGETAEIEDGGSFQTATLGQSAGTAGAPPPSNITVIESRLELTATNATSGRLTGYANARNWIGLLLVLEERPSLNQQGFSISDVTAVETIVAAAGGNVNDIVYGYDANGEQVAYEVAAPGLPVARYDPLDGWVVP